MIKFSSSYSIPILQLQDPLDESKCNIYSFFISVLVSTTPINR